MQGDDIVEMWQREVAKQKPTPIPTPHGPVLLVSVLCGGPDPVWLAGPFRMEEGGCAVAAFDTEAEALTIVARYAGTGDQAS